MGAITSLLVFTLTQLPLRLQMVPGSYLKLTGLLFLLKHPQSWVRSAQTIWKILSDTSPTLVNIANSTMPKSKPRSKKCDPVWLNDECKEIIHNRRKATQKVKRYPTSAIIENLRIIRAKARRTIKSTRCQSWQSFVSKINSRISIKKVWTMVCKIAGKPSISPIRHLQVNDVEITDLPDIANTIAQTFSDNYHLSRSVLNSKVVAAWLINNN